MGLFDEDAVRFSLELANAADERDAAQALAAMQKRGPASSSSRPGTATDELMKWKPSLERWLPRLAAYDRLPPAERDKFLAEINAVLMPPGSPPDGLYFQVTPQGLGVISPEGADPNVLLSLLGFMTPGGFSPRRLAQCQHPKCKRWFLRGPPTRGAVQMYCSPKHAASARVALFRAKRKSKP